MRDDVVYVETEILRILILNMIIMKNIFPCRSALRAIRPEEGCRDQSWS